MADDYYKRGLAINQVIRRESEAAALDLHARSVRRADEHAQADLDPVAVVHRRRHGRGGVLHAFRYGALFFLPVLSSLVYFYGSLHRMQLTFLGATGTVTGSKYLVTAGDRRVLVDCGLFQGLKQLRLRNREPLPIDPRSVDAVVLTHAHLDHSGYLPLFVKNGFRGKVYCSSATSDLCGILLPDSGHLQEEEAAYANRRGFSKHAPALPLYTEDDAKCCLSQLAPLAFDKPADLGGGLVLRLSRSGHILGAAFVELKYAGLRILFSGDIGRPHDPMMPAPTPIQHADYLVVESTYGVVATIRRIPASNSRRSSTALPHGAAWSSFRPSRWAARRS